MSLHCVKCGMSEFHETDNYHDFCECIIPSFAAPDCCKVCRCDLVWHWEFCPRCGNATSRIRTTVRDNGRFTKGL